MPTKCSTSVSLQSIRQAVQHCYLITLIRAGEAWDERLGPGLDAWDALFPNAHNDESRLTMSDCAFPREFAAVACSPRWTGHHHC